MTGDRPEKDPRIEAVAKLLFTGPMFQCDVGDWDSERPEYQDDRTECLMAAEDVLRGIDEAAGWEYGAIEGPMAKALSPIPFESREEAEMWVTDVQPLDGYEGSAVVRRRAHGPWEPLP